MRPHIANCVTLLVLIVMVFVLVDLVFAAIIAEQEFHLERLQ